jgi:hypothetical protein
VSWPEVGAGARVDKEAIVPMYVRKDSPSIPRNENIGSAGMVALGAWTRQMPVATDNRRR